MYEIYEKIEGFGYGRDPRIDEIKTKRDEHADLSIIVYPLKPNEVATSIRKITPETKMFVSNNASILKEVASMKNLNPEIYINIFNSCTTKVIDSTGEENFINTKNIFKKLAENVSTPSQILRSLFELDTNHIYTSILMYNPIFSVTEEELIKFSKSDNLSIAYAAVAHKNYTINKIISDLENDQALFTNSNYIQAVLTKPVLPESLIREIYQSLVITKDNLSLSKITQHPSLPIDLMDDIYNRVDILKNRFEHLSKNPNLSHDLSWNILNFEKSNVITNGLIAKNKHDDIISEILKNPSSNIIEGALLNPNLEIEHILVIYDILFKNSVIMLFLFLSSSFFYNSKYFTLSIYVFNSDPDFR